MLGKTFKTPFLLLLSCSVIGACGTTQSSIEKDDTAAKIDSVLEQVAKDTYAQGKEPLPLLEKMYMRNPGDVEMAMRYARSLRENEYLNRASIVLSPFAHKADSPSVVKTEFSAIQLALGHYEVAEEFAQQAILQDPENYQAYHYLGIALDAKSMHKEAERAFRKGLEFWQGDPTSIMNNLALNLASQGFLDEAEEILQRAEAVAPDRIEVERNLRIINALKQSHSYEPPKPVVKPSYAKKQWQDEEQDMQGNENAEAELSDENIDEQAYKNAPVEAVEEEFIYATND